MLNDKKLKHLIDEIIPYLIKNSFLKLNFFIFKKNKNCIYYSMTSLLAITHIFNREQSIVFIGNGRNATLIIQKLRCGHSLFIITINSFDVVPIAGPRGASL